MLPKAGVGTRARSKGNWFRSGSPKLGARLGALRVIGAQSGVCRIGKETTVRTTSSSRCDDAVLWGDVAQATAYQAQLLDSGIANRLRLTPVEHLNTSIMSRGFLTDPVLAGRHYMGSVSERTCSGDLFPAAVEISSRREVDRPSFQIRAPVA